MLAILVPRAWGGERCATLPVVSNTNGISSGQYMDSCASRCSDPGDIDWDNNVVEYILRGQDLSASDQTSLAEAITDVRDVYFSVTLSRWPYYAICDGGSGAFTFYSIIGMVESGGQEYWDVNTRGGSPTWHDVSVQLPVGGAHLYESHAYAGHWRIEATLATGCVIPADEDPSCADAWGSVDVKRASLCWDDGE